MSGKDQGGDKTELPTPRKLQDARKKGDIAKGKEITPLLGTLGALILLMSAAGHVSAMITAFTDRVVSTAGSGAFDVRLADLGGEAAILMITISATVLLPLAALGVFAEVLQTKGLIAPKKLEPKLENLNPMEGIKRLFGTHGLIELAKTLVKVIAIVAIVWLITLGQMEDLSAMLVPADQPIWRADTGRQAGELNAMLTYSVTAEVLTWVGAMFVVIAIADHVLTRQQFLKKMMMSRRDIKDEFKRDEGDPHIKGHRRQIAQEWAQSGTVSRTADASALLVNPTHLAIAIEYDPETAPVPLILARGEGDVAAAMRDVASHSGVPIIRHVQTARRLWARGEVGEMIPEDLFDAVAEVILWARKARAGEAPMECDLERAATVGDGTAPPSLAAAPH